VVLQGRLDGQAITLSLKRGALTVALDERTVLAFDRAGRLWSFYSEGHHFRRGLNGSVLAKWTAERVRHRRRLWGSEAELVVRRASLIAETLRKRLELETRSETAQEVEKVLARAAAFDVAAARADVDGYYQVYQPIGILPPDQYLALVLQVTQGCSFNTCTFCTFYKDRPFRIKSPQELRSHIAAVRAYLGDSMLLRRGVFLADANALVVPQKQMAELLDVVGEALGERQELFAFQDGFSGQKKSAEDYAALAQRGLRRVYVGLESGHDPLLSWVRKPGRAADALAAVRQIKAGGVGVGVIVMLGLGGERYAAGHVADSIDVLNRMGLGRGDLLYFSEFMPHDTLYAAKADAPDLWSLSRSQMQAQREAIVASLDFGDERPRIASYDIREFVY
jgi:radical SAM superfamily enzyme YgiQ (UPF0313 family)